MRFLTACIAAVLLGAGTASVRAQDGSEGPLQEAMNRLRSGDADAAATIATGILEHPGRADRTALWIRGNAFEQLEEYSMAVRDFARLAQLEPQEPGILMALGGASFKAGDIDGSIDAFDAAAQLEDGLAPQLWQRGISHYYARRLDDCTTQFETHRTVNPQDVENSVWHFLCVAARDGLETARQVLIPVDRDQRVPMMEVFALFSGEGTEADVMEAAESGRGRGPAFYAHLYVGLYHEASGNAELSAAHIGKAANIKLPGNYMWQVARIHRELRTRDDTAP